MEAWLYWFDLLGVAVFAASGALVASRKRMDLIGFGLMASLTGVGGGTLRDLLLGRPVFWVVDASYIHVCLVIAAALFAGAHIIQRRYIVLLWADAIGVAAYAVMGAELARQAGAGAAISIVMGVMTATFGGLIRDVVCGETPLVLRREVYATAAAAGAALYIVLVGLGVALPLAALAGLAGGFALRAAGIAFGLSLPVYRPREGRDYPA